jgi:hypothetical protein
LDGSGAVKWKKKVPDRKLQLLWLRRLRTEVSHSKSQEEKTA